jgi:hypothetical protein
VVYHAPCASNINDPCTATYIGETECSKNVQLKEHHNKVTLPLSDEYASAIGQHACTTDHHFRPEDITYLEREGNKMACGIREAFFARALDPLSTGEADCDIYSRIQQHYLSHYSTTETPTAQCSWLPNAHLQHQLH